MDTTQKYPNVLSLCTGYGGLELGLERALGKIRTLAYVEIEAFAIANLVNKMEKGLLVPAPIWSDLKTFRSKIFRGCVDILTAGYPCQPFSAAGKRKGKKDPRHLWPYVRKAINGCRPTQVFLENVEGHISLGIKKVLYDLERMGYRVEAGIFSAAEVGAPHQRKRVFILAYNNRCEFDPRRKYPRREKRGFSCDCCQKELADACRKRLQSSESENIRGKGRGKEGRTASQLHCSSFPARPGEFQYCWEEPRTISDSASPRAQTNWCNYGMGREQQQVSGREATQRETQSGLGRAAYGASSWVDRLRLLGNGVVPQTAEKAYITLFNKVFDHENRNQNN